MPHKTNVARIGHTCHIVPEISRARRMYIDLFGSWSFYDHYMVEEDRDAILLYIADHMVEPMAPSYNDMSKPVARFLQRYGEGLQASHFMFHDVEEMRKAAKKMAEFGVQGASVSDWKTARYFHVHPKYAHGMNIEVTGLPFDFDPYNRPNWNPKWAEGHEAGIECFAAVSFAIDEIDWPVRFLTEVWGGEVVHQDSVTQPEPMDRCFVKVADGVVGLLAPKGERAGCVSNYIADRFTGVYSVAFKVKDLDQARKFYTENERCTKYALKLSPDLATLGGFAIDPATFMGATYEFTEKAPWE